MEIQAIAEILLYGALFLGMCTLLGTRVLDPQEEEVEDRPQRYRRQGRKPTTTRYHK